MNSERVVDEYWLKPDFSTRRYRERHAALTPLVGEKITILSPENSITLWVENSEF
ncbi:MAG: hypothetical protein RMY29_003085 [Nostoc sp. CreGUA01]